MKTKSIRIPQEIISAVEMVKKEEKIEEASAIRKLMRIGFETYVGDLYRAGKVTLRQAAKLLSVSQIDAMNIFLDAGIKGNLDASDVLISIERFTPEVKPAR